MSKNMPCLAIGSTMISMLHNGKSSLGKAFLRSLKSTHILMILFGFETCTMLEIHSAYSIGLMNLASNNFSIFSFTNMAICGCIFLSFCLTSFTLGGSEKWCMIRSGSIPGMFAYDRANFISSSMNNLMNFGLSWSVKDSARWILFTIYVFLILIDYVGSTNNFDLSWIWEECQSFHPLAP